MNPAEKRVIKGAAFFDAVLPSWIDHIDIDNLSISSGYKCLASQLVPHLAAMYPELVQPHVSNIYSPWFRFTHAYPKLCRQYGLDEKELFKLGLISDGSVASSDLSSAWRTYIRVRRTTARIMNDDFASAMPPAKPKLNTVTVILGPNQTFHPSEKLFIVTTDSEIRYATLTGVQAIIDSYDSTMPDISIKAAP